MRITHRTIVTAALLACCAGCSIQHPIDLDSMTGGSAFLFNQFQCYDGETGRAISFEDLARRCAKADVVLFGEQHGNAVCNQLEAQMFNALIRTSRPMALAMEFFEADTQAALDAYLSGRLDEPDFAARTDRGHTYYSSHRPLIELSHAANVPVIAANAPRRLVREFRKSGLEYEEFRASVSAEDRQWLPASYSFLGGQYQARFAEIMGASVDDPPPPKHGASPENRPTVAAMGTRSTSPASPLVKIEPVEPSASGDTSAASAPAMPGGAAHTMDWREFYRAQLLWDDAMSESIARYRDRYPRRRVMLVVGGFHVEHDGGTAQKLRLRRPDDRLVTVSYRTNPDGQFSFDDEDRGAGAIVIYGLTAPEPEKPESMPPAKEAPPAPESQPTSMPTSQPTSAPTSAPA